MFSRSLFTCILLELLVAGWTTVKVQNASKIITAIPPGENNKRAPLNLGCYGYYIIITAIKIIVRSKGFKKGKV